MGEIPCVHCGAFFCPRNKKQNYCSFPACQKARKAAWQREKLQSDPEYRESQRSNNKQWQQNNPDYWKKYRQKNPAKTDYNRSLQRVRNKRRTSSSSSTVKPKTSLIAKMDASNLNCDELSGQYWLVPVIAKMDVIKIYIHAISGS